MGTTPDFLLPFAGYDSNYSRTEMKWMGKEYMRMKEIKVGTG
jgi:hypothetical protein